MSSSPIVVLGLDAADYALVRKWDCNQILLENHRELKTEAYSLDQPSTFEVWPSIATGVSPVYHGLWLDVEKRESDNSIHEMLARLNSHLPNPVNKRIVDLKREIFGNELPTTNHQHVFDQGAVNNWPGITRSEDFDIQSDAFQRVMAGDLSIDRFRRDQVVYAAQSLGWLLGHVQGGSRIAGVHIHILDYFGHLFGDDPDVLQEIYTIVDDLIGCFREYFDRFVIISDHGMQSSILREDRNPGEHSWRAMISTNMDGKLPESILDVRSWLEPRIPESVETNETYDASAAPTEHLKDLGYL